MEKGHEKNTAILVFEAEDFLIFFARMEEVYAFLEVVVSGLENVSIAVEAHHTGEIVSGFFFWVVGIWTCVVVEVVGTVLMDEDSKDGVVVANCNGNEHKVGGSTVV